ncbi:exosome RNA helicase MTR4-like [Zophobas morio]|uniref:exosome RNA helicase MTR4-like n=1 Tax=Zophobas morio TaxID=2755281 RepID=UPI0030828634
MLLNSLVLDTESSETCTHQVAVPVDYNYRPLSQDPPPAQPAKVYKFTLDPFQAQAIKCLERGESVLVSAHTSAGKTVVAEYAIAKSLKNKQRVIYTTPIKALSNQKYREFNEEFADVGLMTGDVTINPNASCLVMTTEILRSMLYRGSEVTSEVAWVIFDEIHYMRDAERGVVWEETLILLPDNVKFVFLSATIPNAIDFAKWICQLHAQPCHVVYTDYRPTPLQHYIFPAGGDGLFLVVDEKGAFRENNFDKAMNQLAEGMDNAPTSVGGKRKAKQKRGVSDIFKIVKLVMDRQYQPVIVFSFSKRECEAYALQLAKLDFTSEDEKKLIREVFKSAIDNLSEEDRILPQIEHIQPLLLKGIGIHHSGLLPIIKEVIEILFQEGLLKALFATETFAMGLNMPAKTVVFTNVRKFDGKEHRWITSGEYIQMSGRAGRRGLDDRGIVILMVDQKMEPVIAMQLLKGEADKLTSAFHITYNMLLNLLRIDELSPEYILERSFYQFQHNAELPHLEKKLEELEIEKEKFVIDNEKAIAEYYELRKQLDNLSLEMHDIIISPKYILRFLQPGRLVTVSSDTEKYDWGCIVNFQKKVDQKKSSVLVNENEKKYIVDVIVKCSSKHSGKVMPCLPGEKGDFQVIPVLLDTLDKVSAVRIQLPDLRPLDNRRHVEKMIKEIIKRFPDGIPLLDPIEDIKITEDGFKDIISKIELLEKRLYSSELHKAENISELYNLYERKLQICLNIDLLKKQLRQHTTVLQMDDLKCKKRVLRRLGYTSSSDLIEMKGRVACEISCADELLLTEMIFTGVFNDLTVEQAVSLLSCFVFQEKMNENPKLKEILAGPLRQMHESARRIARVSKEAKIPIDEEEYLQSFRPEMMDVVYNWSKGSKFLDICKITEIFEGSIIRCIRREEELLRELTNAAKAIGNAELEYKFNEGITRIKRDIVFAASLYL